MSNFERRIWRWRFWSAYFKMLFREMTAGRVYKEASARRIAFWGESELTSCAVFWCFERRAEDESILPYYHMVDPSVRGHFWCLHLEQFKEDPGLFANIPLKIQNKLAERWHLCLGGRENRSIGESTRQAHFQRQMEHRSYWRPTRKYKN